MKKVLLLLLVFYCLPGSAQDAATRLDVAQHALDQSDYVAAVSHYEALLQAGYTQPAIYLNLGNAYLAQQDLGRAILAYERGLRWAPNHADLRHNVALARSQQVDDLPPLPTLWLVRWWHTTAAGLSENDWAILFLLCWGAGLSLLAARLWYAERARPWYVAAGIGLLLLSVLPISLSLSRTAALQQRDEAIILPTEVTLQAAPQENATTEATLHAGLRVHLLDQHAGSWYKVLLTDGRSGWLPSSALAII